MKTRLRDWFGGLRAAAEATGEILGLGHSGKTVTIVTAATVLEGPHARRKFWQMFTVQGGKLDEDGQSIDWKISEATFRAMIDSVVGLNPTT